jgi:hypothetical protein
VLKAWGKIRLFLFYQECVDAGGEYIEKVSGMGCSLKFEK